MHGMIRLRTSLALAAGLLLGLLTATPAGATVEAYGPCDTYVYADVYTYPRPHVDYGLSLGCWQ
jgi:hypothetical protein